MDYNEFHKKIINETNENLIKYGKLQIREALRYMVIKENISRDNKIKLIKDVNKINISEELISTYIENDLKEGILSTVGKSFKTIMQKGSEIDLTPYAKSIFTSKGATDVVKRAEEVSKPGMISTASKNILKWTVGAAGLGYLLWKLPGFIKFREEFEEINFQCKKDYYNTIESIFSLSPIGTVVDFSLYLKHTADRLLLFNISRAIRWIDPRNFVLSDNDRLELINKYKDYSNGISEYDNILNSRLSAFDTLYNSLIAKTDLTQSDMNELKYSLNKIEECSSDYVLFNGKGLVDFCADYYPYYVLGASQGIKIGIKDDWETAGSRANTLMDKLAKELVKRQDMASVLSSRFYESQKNKISGTVQNANISTYTQTPKTWDNWFNDIYYKISNVAYSVSSAVGSISRIFSGSTVGRIFGIGSVLTLISLAGYYVWKKWFKSTDCESMTGDARVKCEVDAIDKALVTSREELKKCQYTTNPKKCLEEAKKLIQKWEDRKFELLKKSGGDI